MSDPKVGEFLSEHFVAAHQQVGDFRVVNIDGKITKNGGNVASHFLTPDGHVVHSVTGPVSGDVLLQEAKWAVELYDQIKGKPRLRRWRTTTAAHQQALMVARNGQDRQIHQLLMNRPLPELTDVYERIFENVLGENVSEAGPLLADVAKQIERTKRTGRPILFVLHDNGRPDAPYLPFETKQMLNEFTVISVPIKTAPALSQLTGQPPFEASGKARPLIVAADPECKQLASVAGWGDLPALNAVLAKGWMDALQRNPPNVRKLTRAEGLLRKASPANTDWGSELIERLRKKPSHPEPEKKEREYELKGLQVAAL